MRAVNEEPVAFHWHMKCNNTVYGVTTITYLDKAPIMGCNDCEPPKKCFWPGCDVDALQEMIRDMILGTRSTRYP